MTISNCFQPAPTRVGGEFVRKFCFGRWTKHYDVRVLGNYMFGIHNLEIVIAYTCVPYTRMRHKKACIMIFHPKHGSTAAIIFRRKIKVAWNSGIIGFCEGFIKVFI